MAPLTDTTLVRSIREKVALLVNVMMPADPQAIRHVAALGVSRVNLEPNPFIGLTAILEREAGACF